MHFLNVYILFKLRRKATTQTPPLALANGEHPYFGDKLKEIEEVTLEENFE